MVADEAKASVTLYGQETKLVKARQIKQGMMLELLTGRIRLIWTIF